MIQTRIKLCGTILYYAVHYLMEHYSILGNIVLHNIPSQSCNIKIYFTMLQTFQNQDIRLYSIHSINYIIPFCFHIILYDTL
jgi:hypothetical protein